METSVDLALAALKARRKGYLDGGRLWSGGKTHRIQTGSSSWRGGVTSLACVYWMSHAGPAISRYQRRRRARKSRVLISPNLLDQARARALQQGLTISFDLGDAEDLPYEDASFDLVVTMFGAMFAPRPEVVAKELMRVCRVGGRIAMANWTPAGFIGQLFRVMGKHVAPPPGVPAPLLWGDQSEVRSRFRDGVTGARMTPMMATASIPTAGG